jgi:hypothetical protein
VNNDRRGKERERKEGKPFHSVIIWSGQMILAIVGVLVCVLHFFSNVEQIFHTAFHCVTNKMRIVRIKDPIYGAAKSKGYMPKRWSTIERSKREAKKHFALSSEFVVFCCLSALRYVRAMGGRIIHRPTKNPDKPNVWEKSTFH